MSKKRNKSIKKANKMALTKEREQELFVFCYENEITFDQYSPYHYRLFNKGKILDVWCVSKKYWNATMSRSEVYNKVSEIGSKIL